MKKYMTIAALLAAGTAFANAEVGDSFTLDSKITSGNATLSAWNDIQGKNTDTSYLDVDQLGYDSGTRTFTLDVSSMFTSSALSLGENELLAIDTIEIAFRYGISGNFAYQTDYAKAFNLTLTHGDETYTGSAEAYTSADSPGSYTIENNKIGSVSVRLDEALKVTSLSDVGTLSVSIAHEGKFGFAVAKPLSGSTLTGAGSVYGDWMPVVRLSGTISSPIPEPSAFGLLAGMGALALVASRRRRK